MNVKSQYQSTGRLMRQGDPLGGRECFFMPSTKLVPCSLEIGISFSWRFVNCRGQCGTQPTIHSPCRMRQGLHHTFQTERRGVASSFGFAEISALLRIFQQLDPRPINPVIVTPSAHKLDSAICSNPNRRRIIRVSLGRRSRGGKVASNRKHAQRVLTHAVTRRQSVILLQIEINSSALDHQRREAGPESRERFIGRMSQSQ